MRILALDLARATGWAAWSGERVDSGVWRNPHKHSEWPRSYVRAWRDEYVNMLNWHKPEAVIWERPHLRGFGPTVAPVKQIAAIELHTPNEVLILKKDGIHSGTVKKFATGNGRAGKDDVIRAMRERWDYPKLESDDEADALAILAWALEQEFTEGE